MRGLLSILSLFHNELNTIYCTGAQLLVLIYHMTQNTIRSLFYMKASRFCHYVCNRVMDEII